MMECDGNYYIHKELLGIISESAILCTYVCVTVGDEV